jgi:hypothetical protein
MASTPTVSLVYPRVPPRGPDSGVIDADAAFNTEFLDYLRMEIYDSTVEGSSPYTYVGGNSTKPNTTGPGAGFRGSVSLYVPPSLSENYSTRYNEVALGAFGLGVVEGADQYMRNTSDLKSTFQTAAEGMKPEVAMGAVATAMSGVNSALGLQGGQVSAGDFAALTKKKIFNPYMETVFQGVDYRSHNFSFKLVAKNYADTVTIQKVISTLRYAMLPGISGAEQGEQKSDFGGSSRDDRWLTIPDFFKLKLIRYKFANGAKNGTLITGDGVELTSLVQFKTKLVLKSMTINFTPDGQYVMARALQTGVLDAPLAVQLDLNFAETQFLTRALFSNPFA